MGRGGEQTLPLSCVALHLLLLSLVTRAASHTLEGTLLVADRESASGKEVPMDFVLQHAGSRLLTVLRMPGMHGGSLASLASGDYLRLHLRTNGSASMGRRRGVLGEDPGSGGGAVLELDWADVQSFQVGAPPPRTAAAVPAQRGGSSGSSAASPTSKPQLAYSSSVDPSRPRDLRVDSVSLGADNEAATPTQPVSLYADKAIVGARDAARTSSIGTASMAVFIVDGMCGDLGKYVSKEDLLDTWFKNPVNLAGYIGACSYGRAELTQANVEVYGPITMPCSGNSKGGNFPFQSNSCSPGDYYGWQFWLEDWAAAQNPPVQLAGYQHRVMVLPRDHTSWMTSSDRDLGTGLPIGSCDFTGIATVGSAITEPYPVGFVWIAGDAALSPASWFHELGHNYFLRHASLAAPGGENADFSCAMGYCCAVRCFNPPHTWQLGWSDLIATLSQSNLPAGAHRVQTIPVQALAPKHALRVVADWARGATTPQLWFGYRRDVGLYDSLTLAVPPVPPGFSTPTRSVNGVLNIYLFDPSPPDGQPVETHLVASLTPEHPVWSDTALGTALTVRVTVASQYVVSFDVCRRSADTEADCHDGADDDCNGLTDLADPACAAFRPNT
ncbi:hypothetical protein FOA52_009323 [Chlamydomonas sp. UWO 241]|nr:hypothetical protein FOA52_009323 [Chlamydomonas sp. UWO 241]